MKKCDCPGDGGPAFPTPTPNSNHGMTLRDWFAGQALSGYLARGDTIYAVEDYGTISYEFADAMLKARNQ